MLRAPDPRDARTRNVPETPALQALRRRAETETARKLSCAPTRPQTPPRAAGETPAETARYHGPQPSEGKPPGRAEPASQSPASMHAPKTRHRASEASASGQPCQAPTPVRRDDRIPHSPMPSPQTHTHARGTRCCLPCSRAFAERCRRPLYRLLQQCPYIHAPMRGRHRLHSPLLPVLTRASADVPPHSKPLFAVLARPRAETAPPLQPLPAAPTRSSAQMTLSLMPLPMFMPLLTRLQIAAAQAGALAPRSLASRAACSRRSGRVAAARLRSSSTRRRSRRVPHAPRPLARSLRETPQASPAAANRPAPHRIALRRPVRLAP